MQNTRIATALALAATTYVAGCSLIKVNGKPLGGGGTSSSSGEPSSSSSTAASSGSEATGSSSKAAASQAQSGASSAVPEWCEELGFRPRNNNVPITEFAHVETDDSDDDESNAAQFGAVMCMKQKPADYKKIMALRAKWLTRGGYDERDFVVLAAKSRRLSYESQDWTKMQGPVGQLPAFVAHGLSFEDLDKLGSRAAMVLRFDSVQRCLRAGGAHDSLLRDIVCTHETLDVAKADAEIDSSAELNNGTRFELRRMVRKAAAAAAEKRAEIEARAKDDPGIAKVIAIADAQFKQWQTVSAERAALVAQLEAMEAATKTNKYSAFAGCEEKTRAAWEQHLKGVKLPKVTSENTLEAFTTAALSTPEGYLVFQALQLCAAGTGWRHPSTEVAGSDLLQRGPRTATLAAWLAAANDIKFDNRDLTMSFLLANGGLPLRTRSVVGRLQQGVIEKIESANDGTVRISFKEVVEPREDCLKWKELNRIEGFRADGSPMYRRECVKWGTVNMDLTAEPIIAGKVMANGLKPGMYLSGFYGLPIVATSSTKSSQPIWVLGGSVK